MTEKKPKEPVKHKEPSKETFNIDKDKRFSDWYSEILKTAEILDLRYPVKGFPVYRPYGFGIMKRMFQELEKRWDNVDYKAAYFPVMVPEEAFTKEKEHAEGFNPDVFWVDFGKDKEETGRRALRPTSEAVMYPMFSQWIRSYNELPFKVYQTTTVYRFETKATKPLFRGREIYWNEAHAATRNAKACQENVEEAIKVYNDLFANELCVATLLLKRPDWDKFPGADATYAFDSLMPDGRALQIATTHFLGQGFAKAYDVKFMDEDSTEKHAFLTSHGISMRALGGMLSVHGTSNGLVIPFNLATTQIMIVPIVFEGKDEENNKVMQAVTDLKESLKQVGFRVEIDDSKKRPGEKFYHWEMKGVPVRVEIGPKDVSMHQCILVRRDTGEKTTVNYTDLMKVLETLNFIDKDMRKTLLERSSKLLNASIKPATTFEAAKKILDKEGGFVRTGFCSTFKMGEPCAKVIKEKLQANVCGTMHGVEEDAKGLKCVACGKKAEHVVYLAKSY